MVHAAIDIGTNSVLLLIAEVRDGEINPVRQEACISRLGEGIGQTDRLSEQAMDRTLTVLREYVDMCKELGADEIHAVGTAAMRAASNATVFVDRVRNELGIAIDIISDEREAELSFKASVMSFGENIVLMDIGGGSTEFITPLAATSLSLGVVTIAEHFLHADPTTDEEVAAIEQHIDNHLREHLPLEILAAPAETFVAAAGTPTTLASIHAELEPYDPAKVHGTELTLDDIDALIEKLKTLTLEQRRMLKGLQKGREDVILPGAVLLRTAMKLMGYERVTISDRGVRWGLLYDIQES